MSRAPLVATRVRVIARPGSSRPLIVVAPGLVLPAVAQVSAEKSAAMLKPAEGLEATLWASEPMVVNPTNMDVDSRGRVWITEGLNYRATHGGGKDFPRHPDADKIKILEDTDGDGKADKVTVFADKIFPIPMGLAVEEKYTKDGKYAGLPRLSSATAPTSSSSRIPTATTRRTSARCSSPDSAGSTPTTASTA